jgi:hypothetical protein
MDRTRRNMRGSPRGAGSRRGRRFAVAELPEAAAAAAAAATDQHCRHVPSSLPSSAGVLSSTTAFEWHGIRKTLPAASSRRGGAKPAKVSVKKRAALRGVLAAAELDAEEDLCNALERTALRSQRVPMGRLATTARATPAPEHLPLAPTQRLHFTLESARIGRGSMVVASIGQCASSSDRPVVVNTRPDPSSNTCEIVVQNTGDNPIERPFTVRFSIFAMGDMAALGWRDDPHPNSVGGMGRRNSVRRHSVGATAPGVGAVAVVPVELTAADQTAMGVDGEEEASSGGGAGSDPTARVHGTPLWQASWQQIDTVL